MLMKFATRRSKIHGCSDFFATTVDVVRQQGLDFAESATIRFVAEQGSKLLQLL
jgi:hypothetical protein